jgi:hypothetical protein
MGIFPSPAAFSEGRTPRPFFQEAVMKGDFTRLTFDSAKHFSRVLMQQGRVQLDADWNEQVELQLYFLRTLATDLMGPHWGSASGFSAGVKPGENNQIIPFDFTLGPGNYYVDGILCRNEAWIAYKDQPGFPFDDAAEIKEGVTYLAYLDVWERHITSVEDDAIREKALSGPDTATRAQTIWQVRLIEYPQFNPNAPNAMKDNYEQFIALLGDRARPGGGKLQVRAMKPASADAADFCNIPPKSNYRGENQLYLVEVRRGATAAARATFTWSRDNGSKVFPVRLSEGATFTLDNLNRGGRTLKQGDWVELVDDTVALRGESGLLLKVAIANSDDMTVTLDTAGGAAPPIYAEDDPRRPLLRLWDSPGELTANDDWIPLEDGVEVKFEANGTYKTGDYWTFPARVATGDVEWPQEKGADGKLAPAARPPRGVIHHYAPLAVISFNGDGRFAILIDQRRMVSKLWF